MKIGQSVIVVAFVLLACNWRDERATHYAGGQVFERWQEKQVALNRVVKDGKYESFYPDGGKRSAGHFVDDDSVGLWEGWYLNGMKRYERSYGGGGKPSGRSILWGRNGDTLELHSFNDSGELDGRYVSYWFETGDTREEGEYRKGKRVGIWVSWFLNGKCESVKEYDQGRAVGTWMEFGVNGELALRYEYLRDLPPELSADWVGALVNGVPTGTSLLFQRGYRKVDTIPSEERRYGALVKKGLDWVVPFRWSSPRYSAQYAPRNDTLIVWKPHETATR